MDLEHYLIILRTLGAEPFCVISCVAWGYLVRLIPAISDKWVPPICIAAGLFYPLLLPPETRYPLARTGALGLMFGVVSYVLYRYVLREIEHRIPLLKGLLMKTEGASKRYRRGKDGAFEEVGDENDESKTP